MATPNPTANVDLLKAINTLTKAIDGISKSLSSTNGGTGPGRPNRGAPPGGHRTQPTDRKGKRDADTEYERNKRLAKNQEKSGNDLINELHAFNKSMRQMAKKGENNSKDYRDTLKRQNEHTKSILENDKMSKSFQDKFISSMDDLLKSSKVFKKSKLQSTTTGGRSKELINIQDDIGDVLSTVSSIKQKRNIQQLSNMKSGDIRDIVKSMSDSNLSIDGAKSNENFLNKLSEHDGKIAKHKKKIDSKQNALNNVAASGANPGKMNKLTAELAALNLKTAALNEGKAKFINSTLGATVGAVENFNSSMTRSALSNWDFSAATGKAQDVIEKFGGKGISIVSAFSVIIKALSDYYQYVKKLASVQMAGMHASLAIDALRMGTSIESTVKYYQKMGMQISQVGFGEINKIFRASSDSFDKLGLFGSEALDAFGDMAKDIMQMGVHPKNEKNFNSAMAKYVGQINEMALLTGATVPEILAMNKEIINNAESTQMMLRLNASERKAKMDSILVERNRIALMIGSNAEAQKFIQTLQKFNSSPIEKRIENSMKIQQLMQMAGMGSDAGRMAEITRKREDQLTDDDRQFKANKAMELGSRLDKLKGLDEGRELVYTRLVDGQTDDIKSLIKSGSEAKLSQDQNGKVDKNSAVAKEVVEQKQISSGMSTLMDLTNWLGNAQKNPMVALLAGIAVGIGTLVVATTGPGLLKSLGPLINAGSGGAGGILGRVAGKAASIIPASVGGVAGIGSSVLATGGAVLGAGSKLASTIGSTIAKGAGSTIGKSILKKLPGIGLLAGLGFAASRVMDGDFFGAGAEVASGAASLVPGVGTAASVAIDAGLVARDLNKADEKPKPTEASNLDKSVMNAATPTIGSSTSFATPSTVTPKPAVPMQSQIAQDPALTNQQQINTNNSVNDNSSTDKKQPATIDDLVSSIVASSELEKTQMDEMILLMKTLIETVKPENNGLLEAFKNGTATKMSFRDLQDKRTLFATK